jgi:trk system potassium uptake protein TrkH
MVGPECNFHFYSGFGKLVLSFIMIAGRLELSTFLIIFTKHFWYPDRI